MLCDRCEGVSWQGGKPRRPARASCIPSCEWCGAALLTRGGVPVSVRDETLAQLNRFGLAITGEPLLELKGGGCAERPRRGEAMVSILHILVTAPAATPGVPRLF